MSAGGDVRVLVMCEGAGGDVMVLLVMCESAGDVCWW